MSGKTNDALMRQWAMLRLIPRAPRKTSVQELQRRLEVDGFATTSRTVERDLQALSQRFPLIVDASSKPYGWSWLREANFEFAPRLSASQSVALLLSRLHLRSLLPHAMMNELAPVFEQAEKEVSASGWKDWHHRTAVLPTSLTPLAPNVPAAVLESVHHALALKKCLSAQYRAKGNQSAKEMKIHPLGLLVRGNVQYLVCTLRDYQDIRHLALHRFSTVALLDEPSTSPEGFEFSRYIATTGSKYQSQGQIRLVARFSAAAAEHLRDTAVARDQQLLDLADGQRVELSATVENDDTLRWWLLGFGSRVEVVEPASLRDELKEELMGALQRYA